MKFRKKPVVVEAMQLPQRGEEASEDLTEFLSGGDIYSDYDEGVEIQTIEGVMRAGPGDWVIKGVAGEFPPCKPDIFEQTYEPVDQEDA